MIECIFMWMGIVDFWGFIILMYKGLGLMVLIGWWNSILFCRKWGLK